MRVSLTAVLALSIAGVSAAPAAPASELARSVAPRKGSFEVTAKFNKDGIRSGKAALHKAYRKHNLSPTREMPTFLGRRDNGEVTANVESGGALYIISVTIGGQSFHLDGDTGSGDTWVLGDSVSSSSHSIFTASESSTYQELSGETWDITYGDGSFASGIVGTDTIEIGGLIVENQAIEIATKVSDAFLSDPSDGLLGLSFSNVNTVTPDQQKTFFDNAKPNLDSPLFTAYLPKGADGSLTFGTIDSSKYTGTIQYADVDDSNGFWEFPSESYKVGETEYSSSGVTAIADTGTSLVLMGDEVVENYYAAVSGASYDSSQEGYVFDCDATLPDLSVKIGDNYAVIAGTYLNFGSTSSSSSSCFGGLQSIGSGTGSSRYIYGDVFFNAAFGIFDSEGPQFGFAPLA